MVSHTRTAGGSSSGKSLVGVKKNKAADVEQARPRTAVHTDAVEGPSHLHLAHGDLCAFNVRTLMLLHLSMFWLL